jgi:hypothetical protein
MLYKSRDRKIYLKASQYKASNFVSYSFLFATTNKKGRRKSLLFLLFFSLFFSELFAQTSNKYWQQQVNYTIHVSLNDQDKTLDGYEKLIYTNHSPDTLYFIWFHLWQNAYKNDKTAFSEQMLRNRDTRFYFSDDAQQGYINRLDF